MFKNINRFPHGGFRSTQQQKSIISVLAYNVFIAIDIYRPLIFLLLRIAMESISTSKVNKKGAMGSPCLYPLCICGKVTHMTITYDSTFCLTVKSKKYNDN